MLTTLCIEGGEWWCCVVPILEQAPILPASQQDVTGDSVESLDENMSNTTSPKQRQAPPGSSGVPKGQNYLVTDAPCGGDVLLRSFSKQHLAGLTPTPPPSPARLFSRSFGAWFTQLPSITRTPAL